MTFPVLVQPVNGQFAATLVGAPEVRVTASTRAEALAALETLIEQGAFHPRGNTRPKSEAVIGKSCRSRPLMSCTVRTRCATCLSAATAPRGGSCAR